MKRKPIRPALRIGSENPLNGSRVTPGDPGHEKSSSEMAGASPSSETNEKPWSRLQVPAAGSCKRGIPASAGKNLSLILISVDMVSFRKKSGFPYTLQGMNPYGKEEEGKRFRRYMKGDRQKTQAECISRQGAETPQRLGRCGGWQKQGVGRKNETVHS